MLKIVPDPPHSLHTLEETLIQATEYLACADASAQRAASLLPKSLAQILLVGAMHDLETLRVLLGSALAQLQKPRAGQALH